MNKIISGLPSLIGVIGGILLYSSKANHKWLLVIGLFVMVFCIMQAGIKLIVKYPRIGLCLIEVWILSPYIIISITTALIIWLTIHSPTWFNVPADQGKVISGAFIGAITTYFATVWTKDIADGEGYFWPSTQLKIAFKKFKYTGDRQIVDVVIADRVRDGGPIGWGMISRWQRASLLSKHLETQKSKSAGPV